MADIKISALTGASALDGTEEIPIVQTGATVKATTQAIADLGGGGGSDIVIIKYPTSRTITIGAGLTGTTSTVGSDRVTTITQGTGNVSWA